MGNHTYSKTKLGCSIPHNKHISTKILSILLAILMVTTVFSSITIASDSNDDSTEENNIIASILGDVKEKISSAGSKLGSRLRDLIDRIRENRKGLLSLSLVTKYQSNESSDPMEKSTRLRLILPTSIDVDSDGDRDIRVWIIRRPAIDLRPPALCWKTSLIVRRLPGMDETMVDDFLEVYLEYKPLLLSRLSGTVNKLLTGKADTVLDRIRIGYQSPMGEEIPKTCIVSHKNIPHLIYPREKLAHRVAINPFQLAGESQLNLLFSIADIEDDKVISELSMQINHTPAVRNEFSIERSKDYFVRRGQTLVLSRQNVNSNVSLYIKEGPLGVGTLTVDDIPKKLSISWKLARDGYLSLDTEGSDTGPVKAAVKGVIDLGFDPATSIKGGVEWNIPSVIGRLFDKKSSIKFNTDSSIVLDDIYVNAPLFILDQEELPNPVIIRDFSLDASRLEMYLEGGLGVGNFKISPSPHIDSITGVVNNVDVVLENCSIDVEISTEERPTVTIESPQNGETVSDIVLITGDASAPDNKEIEYVQLRIDGGDWIYTDYNSQTETWSYEWDTNPLPNGNHTITAQSFDGEYFSLPKIIAVTVDNEGNNWYPLISIDSPENGAVVSGIVQIRGTANDPHGAVAKVEIRIKKGEWVEVPNYDGTTKIWTYEWDTTSRSPGKYQIEARSFDGVIYSLDPAHIQVSIKGAPLVDVDALDFSLEEGSIKVTNFVVSGLNNNNVTALEIPSFIVTGSGRLIVTEDSLFVEAAGVLDLQNTSIVITASGVEVKLVDNLSAYFDGYGMFLLSNPEIELNLDASLYVHADGIFESAAVTFALDGNASVCIEFDKDNGVLSMGGGLSAEGFVLLDITDLLFDIALFSGFYLRLGADQIKMKGTGSISVEDNSLTADGYLEEFILDNFYVYTDIGVIYLGGEFEFSNTASITLDLVDPYTFNLSSGKGILVRNPYMGIRASGYDLGAKAGSIEIEQGGYVYLSYFEEEINISCHVKTCNVSIIDLAVWFNGSTYDIGNISGSFEFWFYLYLDDLFIDSGVDWIKIIIRGNGKTHVGVHRTFNISGTEGSIDATVDFETGDGTFMIYLYNLSGSIGININGSAVVELTDLHLIYGDIIDLYVPKATGNLELVSISKESGLFMFTMEGGGSSLYLDFSIELGDSDLGLYIVVDNASIDLDDTSTSLKLMWNDSGITNFGFALDADVTLTIDDVDVKLVIEGNDTLNLENLTVYLVGYIGAYVDLVMPFDFVNDTFDINLGDLDVYLGIDDLSVAGESLGRIEISANVTGNATISLLDVNSETQPDDEFDQFFNINLSWINLTIGINATDGVFKLNSFEIESIPIIGGVDIDNLSIIGYTRVDVALAIAHLYDKDTGEYLVPLIPFYIGIRLNSSEDASVSFESFSLAFPLGTTVIPIRLYDGDLIEGVFDVLIRMGNLLALEIKDGSSINTLGLEIADPDHELGYVRFYFDEPFDYLHLDLRDGYLTSQPEEPYIPGSQYLLLDTHNETVTLNFIGIMKMDFLNTSNDEGIRLVNITLSADEFYIYLPAGGLVGLLGEILEGDFSNVSIAGYLKIHSPDGIGLLINGTWYELPFGGEGFDFIITPGHIHIGGSREIYIDEIIEIDGQNLTISGTFFFQTEHDSVDIYYNLTEGMIKIVSNASVGVTDFYFNYGNLTVKAEEFVFEGNSTFTIEGGTITFNGDKAAHLNLTEIHFENQNWNITVSGLFDFFNSGNLTISKNSAGQVEFNIGESLIEVSDFLFIVNNLSILMELFYISAERDGDVNLTFEPGNWTVNSSADTSIVLTNLSINGTDPLLGMDWNLTLSGDINCSRTGVINVKTDLNLSALPEFEVSYVEIGFRDGIFDISDLEFSISDLNLSCDSFQVSAARNVNFTFENGNLTINSSAEASFALTDFYVEGVGPLFGMEWNLTITGSFDFPRNATIHIRTGGSIEIELSSGSVEITNFDFNVNDISASWSLFSIEGSGLLVIENGNIMVDANLTSLTLSNCQFNLPLVNLTIEGDFNLSAAGRFYIISDLASYARFISEGGILEVSGFYLGMNDLNLSWELFQMSASRNINLSIENGNLTINSSAAASVTLTELYVEGIGPLLGMEWDLTVNGGFNLSHGGVLCISTDLANYFEVNLTDGSLVISDFLAVSDNLTLDIPLLSLSADAEANFSANLNGGGSSKGGDNGDGGGGPGFNDGGESDPPDPSHEEDDVYIKLAGTFLISGSLDIVLTSDENFVEVFIDGAGYLDTDDIVVIVETASFDLSLAVTDFYIGVDLDATFRLEDSNLTISGSGDADISITDLDASFKYEGTGLGIIPGDNTLYIDVTFSIPSIDFLLTGGAEEITIELGGAEVLEWISVSPTNSSIYIDDKLQLTATTNPPGYEVNWVSSNESIASVNDTGVVTAHALGTVEIYATAEEISSNSATINVISSQPPDFYITPVMATLGVGRTVQLTPHKQADPVDWWSSNDAIASVDDTGLVTVNGYGSAIITAEDDLGKTATSTIITPENVTIKNVIQLEGDISLSGEGSASVYINRGAFNASIDMVDGFLSVYDFYASVNQTEIVEFNGTSESTTTQLIILSWSSFAYSGSEGYVFFSTPLGSDLKASASVEDLTLHNLFVYTELLPGGVTVECDSINANDVYFLVELRKWFNAPVTGGSQTNYTRFVLDCFSQDSSLEINEIDGSILPNIPGIDIEAEGTGDLDFRRWRIDSGSPGDKKHIYTRIGSKNGFDGKWSITGPFDVLARESRFTITPGHLTIQRNFDSDGYIYIDTGGEYFGIDGEIVWYLFGIGLRFRFFDFGFEADDFYIMWDFLPPEISTSGTILPQLGQVEVEICVDDTWYDALLPPEASYTYTTEDKTLYVDATESFDLDGDIEHYYWKWDWFYPWAEGEEIDSWTYAVHDWRDVSLKVIDNHGKEDIITKTIYV